MVICLSQLTKKGVQQGWVLTNFVTVYISELFFRLWKVGVHRKSKFVFYFLFLFFNFFLMLAI